MAASEPYGDVAYADPGYQSDGKKRYPIDTEEHVRAAWSYINQSDNAGRYSPEHLASIKDRIREAAKKFGIQISDDSDADDTKRSIPRGTLERRVFNFTEVRTSLSNGSGQRRMIGHAAVFNTLSEEMRTPFGQSFREVIRPGAFTKTLRETEVYALFNHNPDMPLARTGNGSLFLHEDKRGLAAEITPTDTSYSRDLLANMDAGLIDKMSFSWTTQDDEWNGKVRELRSVSLKPPGDVSPVTFPAYTDTDIQARSVLASAGLAFDDLSTVLFKAKHAVPITAADRDLLQRSIRTLTGFLSPESSRTGDSVPKSGKPQTRHISLLRARLDLTARGL